LAVILFVRKQFLLITGKHCHLTNKACACIYLQLQAFAVAATSLQPQTYKYTPLSVLPDALSLHNFGITKY
jgi:hypothetical protein